MEDKLLQKEIKQTVRKLDDLDLLEDFLDEEEGIIDEDFDDMQQYLENYSEDEIIAFCSSDYSEKDVLKWLDNSENLDIIVNCIRQNEIW